MKPVHEDGSRMAIVFNDSPLFTRGEGSLKYENGLLKMTY